VVQTPTSADSLEETHCPTCGSSAKKKTLFQRDDGIGFHQCRGCNLQFASPRYTESALLALYEGEAWQKNTARYNGNWDYTRWKDEKRHPYHLIQLNIELVSRYLQPSASLLDVGCNVGLTVKGLEEAGYQAEGVEPSSIGAEIAREKIGISIHEMELSQLNHDMMVDGILMLDVLEHLYNPLQVLKESYSHLNKGGYLFLHVPHHGGISTRYKTLLHKLGLKDQFKHFGFPAHIYAFDKSSLSAILNKAGFTPLHFESWPSTLTNGKVNFINQPFVTLIKNLSLSDYIICVAQKR